MERDMEQTTSFGSSKTSGWTWRMATIALRVISIVLCFISLIILLTNTLTIRYRDGTKNTIHFHDVLGFKYMAATIVLGVGYLKLQIFFAIRHRKNEDHTANSLLDFYGDKVLTNVLATGAVAGFLGTRGEQEVLSDKYYYNYYFNKSYGSASLLFLGFICSFILSVISSYALPKKLL